MGDYYPPPDMTESWDGDIGDNCDTWTETDSMHDSSGDVGLEGIDRIGSLSCQFSSLNA